MFNGSACAGRVFHLRPQTSQRARGDRLTPQLPRAHGRNASECLKTSWTVARQALAESVFQKRPSFRQAPEHPRRPEAIRRLAASQGRMVQDMLIHTDFVSIAGYWLMLDWQVRFILECFSQASLSLLNSVLGPKQLFTVSQARKYQLEPHRHDHTSPGVCECACRNTENTLVGWLQDTNPESRLLHRRLTAIVCSACIPVRV